MNNAIPLFAYFPLWRLVFWCSYGAWAMLEIWVFRRDRRLVAGQKRDSGSMYVLIALIVLALFMSFAMPHLVPLARIQTSAAPLFYFAIALMWGGMALRLWAIQTLGRFFRTAVFVLDEHRLVTTGPYRLLRHPAYTGGILTITGVGVAMGNWISIFAAFACSLIGYLWRIHVEEKALRERFGMAFEQNRSRTWAIIPFVW